MKLVKTLTAVALLFGTQAFAQSFSTTPAVAIQCGATAGTGLSTCAANQSQLTLTYAFTPANTVTYKISDYYNGNGSFGYSFMSLTDLRAAATATTGGITAAVQTNANQLASALTTVTNQIAAYNAGQNTHLTQAGALAANSTLNADLTAMSTLVTNSNDFFNTVNRLKISCGSTTCTSPTNPTYVFSSYDYAKGTNYATDGSGNWTKLTGGLKGTTSYQNNITGTITGSSSTASVTMTYFD